jgi:uncharacterized membrane-anchored protein
MKNKLITALSSTLLLSVLVSAPLLQAAEPASPTTSVTTVSPQEMAQQNVFDTASEAANKAMQQGPTAIPLAGQATLKLPEHFGFIPATEAKRLMEAMGNNADGTLGMIVPQGGDASWFIDITYEAAGYIKDDDAKSWNADELLTSLKEGTEAGNVERKAGGFPEFEVIGWIEKPTYNAAARQLVWSAELRDKGQAADEVNGINYNTYALGREGYISMNLVTDVAAVERLKPTVQTLLTNLNFDDGKRYSDFNASTDKVAEYGLAALIAGVAVKKLGLLAVIAAFALKFWKLGMIVLFGGGSLLSKLFKRKKDKNTL